MWLRSLLCIAFLCLSSTAVAGTTQHTNIDYAGISDPHRQLDVYTNTRYSKRTLVVWIHGGMWQGGDKSAVDRKPGAFVRAGYVFASINYRLVPDVSVFEQATDVATAVGWLRAHASDYGADEDSIVIIGHSAGAHLAALVCTDLSYLTAANVPTGCIKACIASDGSAYDLVNTWPSGSLSNSYEEVFTTDSQVHSALSPTTHVSQSTDLPPFLLLYVDGRESSTNAAKALATALRNANQTVCTYKAKNKTHTTINSKLGTLFDKTTWRVFLFLARFTS